MTADLTSHVAQVDVLDLAGRIITNPRRASISTAGGLALALALESAWEVALEAEILANALEMTMPWSEEPDAEHQERVAITAGRIRDLMAAIRNNTQPPTE
ncbi:MAG: hypothetical protein KF810_02750 [Rhizobiaceae bacterium]|nr:hypothetical protein [Rhizobiaceae bacterium]